jgi:hypothetical protein
LTASDISVFDNNSHQKIVNLRLNQTDGPRALVVLFDLMNSIENSRGAVWDAMKKSLAHMPASDPLSAAPTEPWTEDAVALLDVAMNMVNQLKPVDLRFNPPMRFNTTVRALDDMRAEMAALHGAKELLWATYGSPSSIRYAAGWFDGAPILQQLGARFVQSKITVYTADPGMNLERGMLNPLAAAHFQPLT